MPQSAAKHEVKSTKPEPIKARVIAAKLMGKSNRASVAKNGSSLGNNRYFSANRTKVELLAVFLIMATNSVEFNVDGVLGLDDLESW
jgi:hypothetical protein